MATLCTEPGEESSEIDTEELLFTPASAKLQAGSNEYGCVCFGPLAVDGICT